MANEPGNKNTSVKKTHNNNNNCFKTCKVKTKKWIMHFFPLRKRLAIVIATYINYIKSVIHWKLCEKWGFEKAEKWYMHQPERVLESEDCKILWDFPLQTDKQLEHNSMKNGPSRHFCAYWMLGLVFEKSIRQAGKINSQTAPVYFVL